MRIAIALRGVLSTGTTIRRGLLGGRLLGGRLRLGSGRLCLGRLGFGGRLALRMWWFGLGWLAIGLGLVLWRWLRRRLGFGSRWFRLRWGRLGGLLVLIVLTLLVVLGRDRMIALNIDVRDRRRVNGAGAVVVIVVVIVRSGFRRLHWRGLINHHGRRSLSIWTRCRAGTASGD